MGACTKTSISGVKHFVPLRGHNIPISTTRDGCVQTLINPAITDAELPKPADVYIMQISVSRLQRIGLSVYEGTAKQGGKKHSFLWVAQLDGSGEPTYRNFELPFSCFTLIDLANMQSCLDLTSNSSMDVDSACQGDCISVVFFWAFVKSLIQVSWLVSIQLTLLNRMK